MFILKEIEELWEKFSSSVFKPNILDGKTKELIAVSNSVMADCIPCLEFHYRRAVNAGASKEEIAESLAIAMAIIAGSKKAKYSTVIDKLEKE